MFNHRGRDGVGGFEVRVGRGWGGGAARECRDEFPPPARAPNRVSLSGSRWRESLELPGPEPGLAGSDLYARPNPGHSDKKQTQTLNTCLPNE